VLQARRFARLKVTSPPAARFEPWRRRRRAEERDSSHSRLTRERRRHAFGSRTKILVAFQRVVVIIVQLQYGTPPLVVAFTSVSRSFQSSRLTLEVNATAA